MKKTRWDLFYICTLMIALKALGAAAEKCNGIQSIGHTYPKGDIVIKYGDDLDIYCILDDNAAKELGPNATQYLSFHRNADVMPREMVEVVNKTTIKLHVVKPEKINELMFMCLYKNGTHNISVCLNLVYVGVSPQQVTDFSCISKNLDNLTCSWTAPENHVATYYNLLFSVKTNSLFNCPKIEQNEGSSQMSCTWSLTTDPIYRQSYPDYFFYLNASNVFGKKVMKKYHFKHFAHVKPNPPENLRWTNKTAHSVHLTWTIPISVQSIRLVHRILYRSTFDSDWREVKNPPITLDKREVSFNLNDLEHAHAYYDVRVATRSSLADPKDERLWSLNSSITVQTESERPSMPPSASLYAFELITYGAAGKFRNVRLYWSHVDARYQNGDDFRYVIKRQDLETINETESAHVVFEHLHNDRAYRFEVWSRNKIGDSEKRSLIVLPKKEDCIPEPTRFKKEVLSDGNYRVSWHPPDMEGSGQSIRNYTIFWCNDDGDKPPCEGKLQWTVIPSSSTSYGRKLLASLNYQFAIAANSDRGSSGMSWSQCSDVYNKYSVGKILEFYRVNFGATFIQVKWSFGCSDKGVTGFVVFYCAVRTPLGPCEGPEKNVTVSSSEYTATISGLSPNTIYNTYVAAIINGTSNSQPSKKIQTTTLEAAPDTPPTHLKVTRVTNSTITVAWVPPKITNGKLQFYMISFNNDKHKIDPSTSFTLRNLSSYENYSITLEACTTLCSAKSELLNVRTKIGYPAMMRKPFVTQNATLTVISWEKPQPPNGKIDRYELKIREKNDHDNSTVVINTTDREFSAIRCNDNRNRGSFYASVRAVNLDESGTNYEGSWSDETESYCGGGNENYVIYFLVPAIAAFAFAMAYLFKSLYHHFNDMREVGWKLPPGLQRHLDEIENEDSLKKLQPHKDEQHTLLPPLPLKKFDEEEEPKKMEKEEEPTMDEKIRTPSVLRQRNSKVYEITDLENRLMHSPPSYVLTTDLIKRVPPMPREIAGTGYVTVGEKTPDVTTFVVPKKD